MQIHRERVPRLSTPAMGKGRPMVDREQYESWGADRLKSRGVVLGIGLCIALVIAIAKALM